MREPLAVPAEARSASRDKDAWGKNVFGEKGEDGELRAVLRPGQQIAFDVTDGVSQGVFNYGDDAYWLVDDVLYSSPMPSLGYWVSGGPSGAGYSSGSTVFYQGHLYSSPTNNNLSTPPTGWTELTPTSYSLDPIQPIVSCGNSTNRVWYSADGVTWIFQALGGPSNSRWNGIAWNGSLFCMVGGTITSVGATSPDGLTWSSITMPAVKNWSSIAWNGSVFCALNDNNVLTPTQSAAVSTDGSSWTFGDLSSSISAAGGWAKLVANGSLFCAVALNRAGTATSSDGLTWTTHSFASNNPTRGLGAGGGIFVGFTSNPAFGTFKAVTSSDGITWTPGPELSPTIPVGDYAIAYNGTRFIALGTTIANNGISAYSVDGLNWTTMTVFPFAAWSAACWTGSQFIGMPTAGTIVVQSPDGLTWTSSTLSSSFQAQSVASA